MAQMTAKDFVGEWTDSLGHAITVICIDAFDSKISLQARLTKPNKPDIMLSLRPQSYDDSFGALCGWQCGNAVLDSFTSTPEQLTWVSANGRVSVWLKLRTDVQEKEAVEVESVAFTAESAGFDPLRFSLGSTAET